VNSMRGRCGAPVVSVVVLLGVSVGNWSNGRCPPHGPRDGKTTDARHIRLARPLRPAHGVQWPERGHVRPGERPRPPAAAGHSTHTDRYHHGGVPARLPAEVRPRRRRSPTAARATQATTPSSSPYGHTPITRRHGRRPVPHRAPPLRGHSGVWDQPRRGLVHCLLRPAR